MAVSVTSALESVNVVIDLFSRLSVAEGQAVWVVGAALIRWQNKEIIACVSLSGLAKTLANSLEMDINHDRNRFGIFISIALVR